jgi:hypothetical protein
MHLFQITRILELFKILIFFLFDTYLHHALHHVENI